MSEDSRLNNAPRDGRHLTIDPGRSAVFLDVDGTLIGIKARPEDVRADSGLLELLQALETELGGALALVSGRTMNQLDEIFAPRRFTCAGMHGLERRNLELDTEVTAAPPEAMAAARGVLLPFAEADERLLLEDKGATLALHYRHAPERAGDVEAAVTRAIDAADGALVVLRGKMVFELKPPGIDKGLAIDAFLQEEPFVGRLPVFFGDDVTDEAGFSAVNRRGGVSVRVGEADDETAARFVIGSVADVHTCLRRALQPGR